MKIDELIPRQRRKAEKTFLGKIEKGEAVNSFKTQRLTKDGKILDVWMTVTVLKDESGRPIEIATMERDLAWLPLGRGSGKK